MDFVNFTVYLHSYAGRHVMITSYFIYFTLADKIFEMRLKQNLSYIEISNIGKSSCVRKILAQTWLRLDDQVRSLKNGWKPSSLLSRQTVIYVESVYSDWLLVLTLKDHMRPTRKLHIGNGFKYGNCLHFESVEKYLVLWAK